VPCVCFWGWDRADGCVRLRLRSLRVFGVETIAIRVVFGGAGMGWGLAVYGGAVPCEPWPSLWEVRWFVLPFVCACGCDGVDMCFWCVVRQVGAGSG